jgi:hypothetical protein
VDERGTGEWAVGERYAAGGQPAVRPAMPVPSDSRLGSVRPTVPLSEPEDDEGWEPRRAPRRRGPPETWREHWFGHDQLVHLAGATSHVAVYFDRDMDRRAVRWLLPYLDDAWQYVTQTYGHFGPEARLYSIFHQGRYSGGHPATYFDASHDNRNVTDCGPGPYAEHEQIDFDVVSHEMAHIVEDANNGVHGSPAFELWGDSKWAEFFIHDLYLALGRHRWAALFAGRLDGTTDDYPRSGTHWFRDWWRPLRANTGGGPQVMVRFFQLLAEHFPRGPDRNYARDLNWGEYIHFTSGAAAGDLTDLARSAFGWPARWTAELEEARAAFPAIRY